MIDYNRVEAILTKLPSLTIGVVGDLFLDAYWELDGRLTEPSLETGLPAWQVTHVRYQPGAAGTVLNNLTAMGVGKPAILSVMGHDAHGFALRQALERQGIDLAWLITTDDRMTPTYVKPMLHEPGQPSRELHRMDVKNRTPTPVKLEDQVLRHLDLLWPVVDGLLVVDQVSEPNCGVITERVRGRLEAFGTAQPEKPLIVDSRAFLHCFRSVWSKPNEAEAQQAVHHLMSWKSPPSIEESVRVLCQHTQRPVFCTRGGAGILLAEPNANAPRLHDIPAVPVSGPIDIVGAGDSTAAGIVCALAAGASLSEAAAFGQLVASITIQQLGTTGTATPVQIRAALAKQQIQA